MEKSRSEKIDLKNCRWIDFHFDIALLPINGFGRNFVQNYTYLHCGGDGAGENPPFEALRRALRIRMSSIPPDSYIIRFLSHSRLTRLLIGQPKAMMDSGFGVQILPFCGHPQYSASPGSESLSSKPKIYR